MEESEGGAPESVEIDIRKNQNYALIRFCDMNEEMRIEVMEMIVSGLEKFPSNNEAAARMVKESMDRKFGSSWHAIVGEGYGFEITHEHKNLLYMYFGAVAVLIYKCS